jgi:hypothetical protein
VDRYGRDIQATQENAIGRICFACWITKFTHTHLEYLALTACSVNTGFTKAPQDCVIRPLTFLFSKRLEILGKKVKKFLFWIRRAHVYLT